MRRALGALLIGAAAAAFATAAGAQQPAPDPSVVEQLRQAVRADKRAVVEKNMQLTPEEAKKFWPVYDAYQKDLDRIVQRHNRAVLDYINAESSMTDGNAKRIVSEVLAADAEEQKLRERTLKKLAAALPERKAARFLQIENKIRTLQRFDIAERVPLVR